MKRILSISYILALAALAACTNDEGGSPGAQADGMTPQEEMAAFGEVDPDVPTDSERDVEQTSRAAEETLVELAGGPAETQKEDPERVVPESAIGGQALSERELKKEEEEGFKMPGADVGEAPVEALDVRDGVADEAFDGTKSIPGTTTPAPTFSFSTPTSLRGGHPADAQLSVGFSHICVTARAAVGCYTKGGRNVQIDPSSTSTVNGATFFSSVLSGSEGVFDMRTMYDHFRNRFWIAGLSTSSNRLVVAVSKTANPRHGWWKYWFAATDSRAPNNGLAQGVDYDTIGIDSTAFYSTNIVASRRDCDGNGTVGANEFCFAYVLVNLRDAQQMADGVGGGSVNGWVFWDLTLPGGGLANVAPVVHETSTTRGFLVANNGSSQMSVFSVNNPLTTSQSVSRVEVNIAAFGSTAGLTGAQKPNSSTSTPFHNPAPRVKFDNLGNFPLQAHYRSNKLVFTANDSWVVSSATRAAARVTRLNLANFASGSISVEVDRRFGIASAGDPTGSVFDYGWPAPGINSAGDMAIMTVRTNSSIFPELRMSAWGTNDTDIRSSILVRSGLAALYPFPDASGPNGICCGGQAWVDTAGASTDPYDDTGLYFAQEWPNETNWNNYRVFVAKEFGVVLPDITADSLTTSSATIARGASATLTLRAVNQGDASMPASTGRWYLSTNNIISTGDTALGSNVSVPSIAVAGLSSSLATTVTIPTGIATGTYFIGPCLDTGAAATEYREGNNCVSGTSTSEAIAPIQVTIN